MTDIMDAIEGALKDHGVNWILNEKMGESGNPTTPFEDLLVEIEFAVGKVI